MNSTSRIALPLDFLNSWQFKKITALYKGRMAERCALTLWAVYAHCVKYGDSIPAAIAMGLVRAYDRRDKRRVLWAMTQANLLRRTPEGYRLLAMATVPGQPTMEQPSEQLKLGLDPLPAAAPLCRPANSDVAGPTPVGVDPLSPPKVGVDPHPKPRRSPRKVQKAQRKQALALARAGAMSATQPEKTIPYIDPATTHTEFKELTYKSKVVALGERSEPVTADLQAANEERSELDRHSAQARVPLSFDFEESEAKKKAANVAVEPPCKPKKEDVSVLAPEPSTAVSTLRPPCSQSRSRELAQRDTVETRKLSSIAQTGIPGLEIPMPTLMPTAIQVVEACTRVWPSQPLPLAKARTAVERNVTFDELKTALDRLQARVARGDKCGPGLLLYVVEDLRKEIDKKPGLKRPMHATHPQGGEKPAQRKAFCAAIREMLAPNLLMHECVPDACHDAMLELSPGAALSLYSEMYNENWDTDWRDVGDAVARGRRPAQTGLLPPASDKEKALAGMALFKPNVKSLLDRVAMAG